MLIRKLFVFIFSIPMLIAGQSYAQWRCSTPRDVDTVWANKPQPTVSNLYPPAKTEILLTVSGQYTELGGAAMFDAGYAMKHPGWNVPPYQRTSPPYKYQYNGKDSIFGYGLKYSTINGSPDQWFVPAESSFVSNHIYTQKIAANGIQLNFRISAAQGVDYKQAAGFLVVKLERWTAGICIKQVDVPFGSVPYGTSKTIPDSIASYGINPLFIDSIYIDGPNKTNFSFDAHYPGKFLLPNFEQTHEIAITFTPKTSDTSHAILYIICKNADDGARPREIKLTGFGAKPELGIITKVIPFGKVRIGYPKDDNAFYANTGNSDLLISKETNYDQGLPGHVVFSKVFPDLPVKVVKDSKGQIITRFAPLVRTKYKGVLHIIGNDKTLTDSVILTGEGAEPVPEFDPSSKILDFGSVYSGDSKVFRELTITNTGNWPVTVTKTTFSTAGFFYTPNDTYFVIDPGSSRKLTFWFNRKTGIEGNFQVDFTLEYDNWGGTIDKITLVGKEITPKTHLCDTLHNFGKVKVYGVKPDTITCVTNVANVPLPFSEYGILPSKPFSLSNIVGSIDPNSTIQVMGSFQPRVAGPAYAWFFVSANGRKDSVLLLGEGVIAKGIFTPPIADFKIVPSNRADIMAIGLSDSGSLPLRVIRYEITGPDKADFRVTQILQGGLPITLSPFTPFTIKEDSLVEFKVRFITNAKTGAVHSAMLCVYYDDSTSDCMPLQAIEEAQYVQFAIASVDFGKVRVKKNLDKPATFRNGSNITLNVGKVEISPLNNVFSISDTLSPINKADTFNLRVNFHPTYTGKYAGWLVASGRDFKKDSIALRGEGAAPVIDFNYKDSIMNFGIVKLTASSTLPQLTVSNLGNWQLNAINVFIRNDKYGEFSYSKIAGGGASNNTLIVDEVDSLNVINGSYDVTFQPSVTSVYHSADLVFLLDDSSEHIVRLIGLDESPNLVLGEDTIKFGKVRIGRVGSRTAHLINTSPETLTTMNVHLQSGVEYTATPLGKIVVPPYLLNRQFAINVTFTPGTRKQVQAYLISDGGGRVTQDTTVLLGTGANPVATFTPSTELNFGGVLYSTTATPTFNLHNTGNWIFRTIKFDMSGPNAADFIPSVPQIFSIEEDSSRNFSVSFTATTPFQIADRTATIVFMLDDSSEVRYDLKAHDNEPFKTDLRFDNVSARIGDIVYPYLRLVNVVPDTLNVNHLKGTITYDATVVNLVSVRSSDALVNTWTLTPAQSPEATPGVYAYEMTSATDHLHNPVAILRLEFKPLDKDRPGAQTTLTHSDFSYPGRKEVEALLTDGVIVIDSACGNTHLLSGTATGTFVDQNHPNPFSIAMGSSTIPFDIGSDDVAVTIRILDMTGREVARPIDNQSFKRGRYSVVVDALQFTSGSYFYEFHAGSLKPQIKKMVIGK